MDKLEEFSKDIDGLVITITNDKAKGPEISCNKELLNQESLVGVLSYAYFHELYKSGKSKEEMVSDCMSGIYSMGMTMEFEKKQEEGKNE